MSIINPLAGAFAGATQVQRTQSAERDLRAQRAEAQRRASAVERQRHEDEVETTDAVILQSNEEDHPDQRRQKRKAQLPTPEEQEEQGGLDLTA